MRAFFQSQLDLLPAAGIRQVEFLTADQIKLLLDSLCVISEKKFGYIPATIQQTEIKKQIIEDPDFNGINTRWLFKILTKIAEPYWRSRMTEEELTPQPEPVSPERADYWISEWRKALNQMNENFSQAGKGGGSRLKESLGIEKAQSVGVIKNYEIGQNCPECQGKGFVFLKDGLPGTVEDCNTCLGKKQINVFSIPATSEAEARKQYTELFGS